MKKGMGTQVEQFVTKIIDRMTEHSFVKAVIRKYHYEENDFAELLEVAEQMKQRIGGAVICKYLVDTLENIPHAKAVISLGPGVDSLQEHYSATGQLMKCYMVESLAGELLLAAYGMFNQIVEQECGLYVSRYHFLGSDNRFPLEQLPHYLSELDTIVSCNQAYMMLPKKSVVFMAELSEDSMAKCEGICVGCGKADCPNRMEAASVWRKLLTNLEQIPLNYGVQRIFGTW